MVGTLAEAAAEAVGANALLCRVGAYYHDIGKTRHPTYFIENSTDASDRHEKLAPSLSRAIVMSHVKEGIEMAREYGLPDVLVDMIPQHHGTRLVSFFYQRAKDAADPGLQAVNEEDYRYLGPKPQTREAAILMLADAVQAATHTLADPTPARIRGAVQKIINAIFVDASTGRVRPDAARPAYHCQQFRPDPDRLFPSPDRVSGRGTGGRREEAKREWRSVSEIGNRKFPSKRPG